MYFRPAIFALFAALLFACGTGCQKNGASSQKLTPTVLSPDTLASVHWVGKRRLDLEADAYYVSRVWSLPETVRLQSQTFDRFSVGVWRLLLGDQAGTRIPAAVLRPLLDELTERESYLEIRAATGAPPAFVLATQVSARYAGVWETNLAIAAELLTGAAATADSANHGWTIQCTNLPDQITLTHVGDWTVLSVGPTNHSLADDIAARIRCDGTPFVSAGTNLWLEASLNFQHLAAAFPSVISGFKSQTADLSHLNFSLSGDGANVITRAKLSFVKPLPDSLESWHLPLPLLHEPLTSFTAVRDLQPLLEQWLAWRELSLGAPPGQLFYWSLSGTPYQVYLAAPMSDARQHVSALSDWLMQKGNPWLSARGYINFDRALDGNGVTWGNLPDIKPFIKSASASTESWLYAGLLPDDASNAAPAPAGMIQDILHRTNLVYYGWEVTGPRLHPCLELGQTARLIARRAQMPLDSASLTWLAALVPRLGTSATLINRTGAAELTFYRRSTLGLTAPELHLLADWLESPRFPYGLHSSAW